MRHFILPLQTHAFPNNTQKVKGTCVTLHFHFFLAFSLLILGSFILDSRISGTHNSTPFQPVYYSWQWHLVIIAMWMINWNRMIKHIHLRSSIRARAQPLLHSVSLSATFNADGTMRERERERWLQAVFMRGTWSRRGAWIMMVDVK